jgi:diacylglycerol kinase family enzyme
LVTQRPQRVGHSELGHKASGHAHVRGYLGLVTVNHLPHIRVFDLRSGALSSAKPLNLVVYGFHLKITQHLKKVRPFSERNDRVIWQEQLLGNPFIDPAAPLIFVVNAAAGTQQADAQRGLIEAALKEAGRIGEWVFSQPGSLAMASRQAAFKAAAMHTAVVAVGGDGTVNTVAQAVHAKGCVMGVIPHGTFNYFARTHGITVDKVQAIRTVLGSTVKPVQVATVNKQVFLVNASLGLYPTLLEDREAYKARFGRSRLVALGAACATLLRAHRQLRLHIELGAAVHDVRTTTVFVGNSRLQLAQVGVQTGMQLGASTSPHDNGRVAAVMLRPMGTLAMAGLMLRGAMGTLGDADSVESFEFEHMVVRPRSVFGRRKVKVAFDGEVRWMRWPIEFEVSPKPLYLLKPDTPGSVAPF